MTDQRIIVIGASAGGVETLSELVRLLPPDFGAPILLVLHVPADSPSALPDILSRKGNLNAKHAEDGERYRNGIIYIAPPDRHLIIKRPGTLRTPRGPRENRHRPAVDPLFRSAALMYGPRAIGVILSGTRDDGTAGLLALRRRGGIAIVQDPEEAIYPGMPLSAISHVDVDEVLTVPGIAARLVEILDEPIARAPEDGELVSEMEMEQRIALMDELTMQDDHRPGEPSPFSCPDCGGVLWQIDEDGEYVRYRCRVGHAFSPETMLGAQADVLEEALWSALKTLEESARLAHRLASDSRVRGHDWMAKRFEEREREARQRAELIRRFLSRDTSEVPVAESV